jgi:hypothetical protein
MKSEFSTVKSDAAEALVGNEDRPASVGPRIVELVISERTEGRFVPAAAEIGGLCG